MQMKLLSAIAVACVACGASFVGGFLAGRQNVSEAGRGGLRSASIRLEPPHSLPGNPATNGDASHSIARLVNERSGPLRAYLLAQRLNEAGADDFEPILVEIERLPLSVARSEAILAVYRRWGEVAPERALESLSAQPLSRGRQMREDQVLAGWAGVHPAEAWDWLSKSMGQGTGLYGMQRELRFMNLSDDLLASGNVEGVKEIWQGLSGRLREMVGSNIMRHLAKYDIPSAVQWIANEDGRSARNNAVAALVVTLAREEGPEFAAAIALHLDQQDRVSALGLTMREWALTGDLRAAESWIAVQPSGLATDAAIEGFVTEAANKDPLLAARVFERFSHPEGKKYVGEKTLKALTNDAPESALVWITATSSEQERPAKIDSVIHNWAMKNPRQVADYLESATVLSDQERTRLQAIVSAMTPKQ